MITYATTTAPTVFLDAVDGHQSCVPAGTRVVVAYTTARRGEVTRATIRPAGDRHIRWAQVPAADLGDDLDPDPAVARVLADRARCLHVSPIGEITDDGAAVTHRVTFGAATVGRVVRRGRRGDGPVAVYRVGHPHPITTGATVEDAFAPARALIAPHLI